MTHERYPAEVIDRELDQLVTAVDGLFGEEASCAANDRAYDRALQLRDEDPEVWLRVFMDASKSELRRLLQRH